MTNAWTAVITNTKPYIRFISLLNVPGWIAINCHIKIHYLASIHHILRSFKKSNFLHSKIQIVHRYNHLSFTNIHVSKVKSHVFVLPSNHMWAVFHKHVRISQYLLMKSCISQAYTSKRRILIEVPPVPNAYTKSANACIHYAKFFCYAYMHEQTTKGFGKMNICITRFGIRIGDRKYLNEYTPIGSVSLCFDRKGIIKGVQTMWPLKFDKLIVDAVHVIYLQGGHDGHKTGLKWAKFRPDPQISIKFRHWTHAMGHQRPKSSPDQPKWAIKSLYFSCLYFWKWAFFVIQGYLSLVRAT